MKIAFIAVRPPFPLTIGGRIRTFHLLKAINRVHEVTLVTAVEGKAEVEALDGLQRELPKLRTAVVEVPSRNQGVRPLWRLATNLFDPLPYTWAAYWDPKFIQLIRDAIAEGWYDVVHCEQVHIAKAVVACGHQPIVVNTSDVQWVIINRAAQQEQGWLRRQIFRWQAMKTFRSECDAYARCQRVIAVSEVDRQQIARCAQGVPIDVVPNGVDIDFFKPTIGMTETYVMVFTGAMDWLPNQNGVRFFVKEVLPRIRRQMPEAQLWIVGRNPSASLRQELTHDGVWFSGTVDDIRSYLHRASLVVVPLRIGGGTRLKILEAWAVGKPVLSTTLGAEGLPARHGENIMLADTPELLAERAVDLLSHPRMGLRMGQAGRQTATEQFAWDRMGRLLLQAYEAVVRDYRHRGSFAITSPDSKLGLEKLLRSPKKGGPTGAGLAR